MAILQNLSNSISSIKDIAQSFIGSLKKINRWKLFLFLLVAASLMAFYVNNVMTVKQLLVVNQKLKKEVKDIQSSNKIRISRIIELQSTERIIPIATNQLGMVMQTEAPIVIDTSEVVNP